VQEEKNSVLPRVTEKGTEPLVSTLFRFTETASARLVGRKKKEKKGTDTPSKFVKKERVGIPTICHRMLRKEREG